MLESLERKLVAVIGDLLASRAHLAVVQAGGIGDEPGAGQAIARVAVETVEAEGGFDRDVLAIGGTVDAPTSRRVLPVRFGVTARFGVRPVGAAAAARTAARHLLLGDVSAAGHALAATRFVSGAGFATEGDDPGFEVRSFELTAGELEPPARDGEDPEVLRAVLRWAGRAAVWPIAPPQPEGMVAAVDVELVPVPLGLKVLDPILRPGASTTVVIGGVGGRRLTNLDPSVTAPVSIAVSVSSDLPNADRGRIEGGTAGSTTGVRIVRVDGPRTSITYRAPTASLGSTRVEYVEVHLATPTGGTGVFLDAVPVQLVPS